MADGEYKLAELSELAGVPQRTIRYYVAKDLLPGPTRGSKSRYSDEHLARLRVIRKLQDVPLPLDVIRETLNKLSGPTGEPQPPEHGVESAEQQKESPAVADDLAPGIRVAPDAATGPADVALGYIRWAGSAAPTLAKKLRRPAGSPPTMGQRSNWERISVTGDLELHVRRPLSRSQNRALEQLLQRANELFGEDQV